MSKVGDLSWGWSKGSLFNSVWEGALSNFLVLMTYYLINVMRTRKLLETKIYRRNRITGINNWAVPLVRYSVPFLKWTGEELKQMEQRTRKLRTMHKALHPRDDTDNFYVSRKEEQRGLAKIQDSVNASIKRLKDDIHTREGEMITAIKNNRDNTIINRTKITRKQKWGEKQLYGHFKRQTNEISDEKTWT